MGAGRLVVQGAFQTFSSNFGRPDETGDFIVDQSQMLSPLHLAGELYVQVLDQVCLFHSLSIDLRRLFIPLYVKEAK